MYSYARCHPPIYRSVIIIFALVITGCVGKVKVIGQWEDKTAKGTTYDRILIVGVSHNGSARCDYEMFLRTQIEINGTGAQASCILMSVREELTRERVVEAVNEYQADAVLATVLVTSGGGAEQGGKRDTRGGLYFKPKGYGYRSPGYYRPGYYRGGYGVYGVPVVYGEWKMAPVITSVDGEVTIHTMLFDTASESLVYEMVVAATDLNSRDGALSSVTPPIAKELRSQKLIK